MRTIAEAIRDSITFDDLNNACLWTEERSYVTGVLRIEPHTVTVQLLHGPNRSVVSRPETYMVPTSAEDFLILSEEFEVIPLHTRLG